jgi:hypothetical protein
VCSSQRTGRTKLAECKEGPLDHACSSTCHCDRRSFHRQRHFLNLVISLTAKEKGTVNEIYVLHAVVPNWNSFLICLQNSSVTTEIEPLARTKVECEVHHEGKLHMPERPKITTSPSGKFPYLEWRPRVKTAWIPTQKCNRRTGGQAMVYCLPQLFYNVRRRWNIIRANVHSAVSPPPLSSFIIYLMVHKSEGENSWPAEQQSATQDKLVLWSLTGTQMLNYLLHEVMSINEPAISLYHETVQSTPHFHYLFL